MRVELISHSIQTGTSVLRVHYNLADSRPATECRLNVYDPDMVWVAGTDQAPTDIGDNYVEITVNDEKSGPYTFVISAVDDHAIQDKMLRNKPALDKATKFTLPRVCVVGVKFTKTNQHQNGDSVLNKIYLNDLATPRVTELPQWKAHLDADDQLVMERQDPIVHKLHATGHESYVWVWADLKAIGSEIPAGAWIRARLGGHATALFGASGDLPLTFYGHGDTGQPHYVVGYVSDWDAEDYATFWWRSGPLPGVVDKWTLALDWTLQWAEDSGGPWFDVGGQHTYHTTYTTVEDPLWMANTDDKKYPWRDVLNKSTEWGVDTSGATDAACALTIGIYVMPAFDYPDSDQEWYDLPGYGNVGAETFKLHDYLDDSASISLQKPGQCTDVAALLVILARSLGVPLENFVIDDIRVGVQDFATKLIDPIGSPGWMETEWNYHEIGGDGTLYDACLMADQTPNPPVLPRDVSFATYEGYVRKSGDLVHYKSYVPTLAT